MPTMLCMSIAYAQKIAGIYVNNSHLPSHADTLYIHEDGSFEYAFYYPEPGISESYSGSWSTDGSHLFLVTSPKESPDFVLGIYHKETGIDKLVMIKAPGFKQLKDVLFLPL